MRMRTARLFVTAMALVAIGCSETPPPPPPAGAQPAGGQLGVPASAAKAGPRAKSPKLGTPTGPTDVVP
jgi:hypothetical protein